MAENLLLKQLLITLTHQRSRAPRLISFGRILFGYLTFFVSKKRLQKIAIVLQSVHFEVPPGIVSIDFCRQPCYPKKS